VPGDLLDVILVALAAAFAVEGYRQGFVVGGLGVIGFLGGAAAGAALSPGIAQVLGSSPSQRALVAIVVVFLIALTGQLLASLAGAALRSRLAWRPATVMDAAGGAAVSALSVLLIAWFIGSAVASAPFPAVARQVDYSVVLRGVGRLMPGPAHYVFSGFGRMLGRGPSGQVFWGLGGAGAWAIRPPDPGVVHAPGLASARPSIVMIEGSSATCRAGVGSGFVVARHHVLTNAHVVAATTSVVVEVDGRPAPYRATVVYFDPRRDIAMLYVPSLNARPLHLAPGARRGSEAIVAGYPGGRALTAAAARIGAKVSTVSPSIYRRGAVIRHVYTVRAGIQPGDSGSPLLATDGSVYGMVFAALTDTSNAGYALAGGEVSPAVRAAARRTAAVSTQPWHCPAR
jgi:S1-C subfamily serine protease